jgi:hypothetical protein
MRFKAVNIGGGYKIYKLFSPQSEKLGVIHGLR